GKRQAGSPCHPTPSRMVAEPGGIVMDEERAGNQQENYERRGARQVDGVGPQVLGEMLAEPLGPVRLRLAGGPPIGARQRRGTAAAPPVPALIGLIIHVHRQPFDCRGGGMAGSEPCAFGTPLPRAANAAWGPVLWRFAPGRRFTCWTRRIPLSQAG